MSNTDFIINVNYEKREMKRDDKKIKIYYLFFINISIKENKNFLSLSKFDNEHFNTKVDKENSINQDSSSQTSKSEIDKIIHTSMNQKLLYSNKLSTYLLKKYFNIKFYFQKNKIKMMK